MMSEVFCDTISAIATSAAVVIDPATDTIMHLRNLKVRSVPKGDTSPRFKFERKDTKHHT